MTNRLIAVLLLLSCSCFAQEVAFTFDDAPTGDGPMYSGAERAKHILSHLKNNGVDQAAFFVITKNWDAADIKRLQQYADAGHLLANHTQSHLPIQQLGTRTYIRDIQKADSALRHMKGFTPWFRYPFLDEGKSIPVRDSIRAALKVLGLTNGYVTIDNYDWYINHLLKEALSKKQKVNDDELRKIYIEHIWNSLRFYDQVSQRALGRSAKHVLLLHENDLAAHFLGDLIKHIKAQGWKIISPAEAYQDAISSTIPDVLFNGQGRIAAIAREKGINGRELVQESEDEVYLEELMKTRKVFE